MKNIYNILFTLILIPILTFTSCSDDDPVIPNEEELITTVNLTLSPADQSGDIVLSWKDLDGDGNGDITGGTLTANTVYSGSVTLFNESETPIENITLEVKAEDVDHQFFYEAESSLNLVTVYSDMDTNGKPTGLLVTMTAGDASSGSLTVILRHEPDKSATGVSDGDKTNAGGSTDVEISFPITIQ